MNSYTNYFSNKLEALLNNRTLVTLLLPGGAYSLLEFSTDDEAKDYIQTKGLKVRWEEPTGYTVSV